MAHNLIFSMVTHDRCDRCRGRCKVLVIKLNWEEYPKIIVSFRLHDSYWQISSNIYVFSMNHIWLFPDKHESEHWSCQRVSSALFAPSLTPSHVPTITLITPPGKLKLKSMSVMIQQLPMTASPAASLLVVRVLDCRSQIQTKSIICFSFSFWPHLSPSVPKHPAVYRPQIPPGHSSPNRQGV